MLTYTFCHIKGISCTAEKRLWDGGIISWDDYLKNNKRFFSYKKDQFIRKQLEISKIALEADSIDFFFSRLSNEQQVRVYPHFKNKMVFLDIETTGLSIKDDSITTIAIYNGHTIKNYINGQNIWNFIGDITKYSILVTYNGTKFDIPFLKKFFGINLNLFHIDLCHVLHNLGYWGGLKECERKLGIQRQIEGIDGVQAVQLWSYYKNINDNSALKQLILYNSQDVLSLEHIIIKAYNKIMKDCPVSNNISLTKQPSLL